MDDQHRGDTIRDNLHIRLFTARCATIGPGWNARGVRNSYWRLYRNAAEGASLEIAGGNYPLEAGQIYLVPAGVTFHCRCTTLVEHFWVHFDVLGPHNLGLSELFPAPAHVSGQEQLYTSVEALARDLAQPGLTDLALQCEIKALVYQALAGAFNALPPERWERYRTLENAFAPVLPAIEQIERDLAAPLSVEALAALCCLSADYFIRRFRHCTGRSPGRYIAERRVMKAAQLLLFTDLSIEQVAEQTGFGNRFYFTRVFTRHTGSAPAAYRRSSRV